METRSVSSAASAARLTVVTSAKMASVAAIFFLGLALGHGLGVVPQRVQLRPDRLDAGQRRVAVAFLRDQLAADLAGAQPGVEPGGPEGRVGLALAADDGFQVG